MPVQGLNAVPISPWMPGPVGNGRSAASSPFSLPAARQRGSGTVPEHHCDLVEGTMLGQGGFHGPGSIGSFSKGLFSSSVEGSALPAEAVEPVPAEAASSPSGCSITDQQDTCKNARGCRALAAFNRKNKRAGRRIRSLSPSCPDPLFPVFIVPSRCVMSNLGRKLPWDGTCHF